MNTIKFFIPIFFLLSLLSCKKGKEISVVVLNPMNVERQAETIEIPKKALDALTQKEFESLGVVDSQTGKTVMFQLYDQSGDGRPDVILFQPKVPAGGSKSYLLLKMNFQPRFKSNVYSRFVPERTDDYAWENDRVAFRTFGPTAQKMIEEKIPGGTLTSGIDCWLKKVDYPIINKWYKKHTTGKGSYHEDTGEGFDNYHVGSSRGCGGIGIWEDDTLWASKNFTGYKTLANGPIRTAFELTYAPWKAGNKTIEEHKIISLDLGSNLSRIEVYTKHADTLTAGITLHEKTGKISIDSAHCWAEYWEAVPEHQYEMGCAVLTTPEYCSGFRKHFSPLKDHSHLMMDLKVKNGKTVYYSGFFWTKSKQFNGKEEWEKYLTEYAEKLKNPLKIKVNGKLIN
jgi:hypothetical protein